MKGGTEEGEREHPRLLTTDLASMHAPLNLCSNLIVSLPKLVSKNLLAI